MRTLTEDEKRWDMEMMLRTLPKSICRDPQVAVQIIARHPLWRRWEVHVPDPLPNHG